MYYDFWSMIKVNFVSNASQHLITKMGDSQKVSLLKRYYFFKKKSTTYTVAKVDTTTIYSRSTYLLYM